MTQSFKQCRARDLVTVDASRRVKTGDGYLYAPGHLARAGNVQAYRASELGLDGDPNRVVRLLRPPEEVFSVDAIKSFEAAPVTLNHPAEGWVTAKNWRNLTRGEAVGLGQDGEHLAGELRVRDEEAVRAIETKDKEQLSAGYAFDLDPTAGTSPNGEAYDGIQRNIRGNHFAIVGAARGGNTCRIADEKPNQETHMSTRKIVVDGLPPFEIDELAAGAIENHIKTLAADRDAVIKDFSDAVDSHKAKLATQDAELTAAKTSLSAKDTEIASLKDELKAAKAIDVDALVAERSQVVDEAKKLAPDLKPTGSALDIRKAAIVAACADELNKTVCAGIFGKDGIEKATPDQIKGAFATLLALPRQTALDAQNAAIGRALGVGSNSAGVTGSVERL